ncbi:MerR family transcriptional regulator [Marinobacterium litorale]|uniref:MerR family transcriptional regulator n=1 Tax=Marinobacterium litorale TaxID=404770 RepID=UPI0012EB263C|nr:MerR family transcriptional regulator [Marinobacterium litorale]
MAVLKEELSHMYIGELCKRTGASRKAIYLYEQLGLIPTPPRQGSYRVYSTDMVELVKTIRCAQSLGFKLKELTAHLLNETGNRANPEALITLIERKQKDLRHQLEITQHQLVAIEQLKQDLAQSPDIWTCNR